MVLTCFFFSGLTGLIYEILWTRMIVKIIGGAPFAVSIVLMVFMAGFGIGSYIASRTIDRIKEPAKLVRIYGILELAIGAYGLLIPLLLSVVCLSMLRSKRFEFPRFAVYGLDLPFVSY